MDYENKMPDWQNVGSEPSEALKKAGFESGKRVPANIFNWLISLFSKAITELQNKISKSIQGTLIVPATSADGVTYTVDISEHYDNIYNGLQIIIIADTLSNTTSPVLRVITKSGAVDRTISLGTTQNTGLYQQPPNVDFISPDTPIVITFNTRTNRAMITDYQIVRANNLYGNLPLEKGGTGATNGADALSNLGGAKKDLSNVTGTLPVKNGGTGYTSVDAMPTSGSPRMVTSGGVHAALGDKADYIHKHPASDITSGTFLVPRGGTGRNSVTANSFLVGNGTGALLEKTPAEVLALIGGSRAQYKSYVGTGYAGESYPCSLTFDIKPSVVLFVARGSGTLYHPPYTAQGNTAMIADTLTTSYKKGVGFRYGGDHSVITLGKKSADGKTFMWHFEGSEISDSRAMWQLNSAGETYHFLGIE